MGNWRGEDANQGGKYDKKKKDGVPQNAQGGGVRKGGVKPEQFSAGSKVPLPDYAGPWGAGTKPKAKTAAPKQQKLPDSVPVPAQKPQAMPTTAAPMPTPRPGDPVNPLQAAVDAAGPPPGPNPLQAAVDAAGPPPGPNPLQAAVDGAGPPPAPYDFLTGRQQLNNPPMNPFGDFGGGDGGTQFNPAVRALIERAMQGQPPAPDLGAPGDPLIQGTPYAGHGGVPGAPVVGGSPPVVGSGGASGGGKPLIDLLSLFGGSSAPPPPNPSRFGR